MQLAHAADYELTRFRIFVICKRRIFSRKDRKRIVHPVAFGKRFGFEGDGNDGFGKLRLFEQHRHPLASERVARLRELQSDEGGDIARRDGIDRLFFVRVDPENSVDPLALFFVDVVHLRAARNFPRIHAHKTQKPHIRIVLDFKHQADGGSVFFARHFDFFFFVALYVQADGRRHFVGRRKIIDNCIDERLHALIVAGASHDKRNDCARYRLFADRFFELFDRYLFSFEI